MNFYYAITNLQGELWFIFKSPTEENVPEEIIAIDKACNPGMKIPGMKDYDINEITQVEFETYQAFGIDEIKL